METIEIEEVMESAMKLPARYRRKLLHDLAVSVDKAKFWNDHHAKMIVRSAFEVAAKNVIDALCSLFDTDEDTLFGKSKERKRTWPRYMFAHFMHSEGYSYTEIARRMNQNHATAIHSVEMMDIALSTPAAYRDEVMYYNELKSLIYESNSKESDRLEQGS